ncbi:Permease [Candidatus Sulfotelmatomonas gaucii]|uniref:Permease n=1 Tax=Candidatus Sulfuritelmatomonas gaucii TaxID=2043161 RepID=A0A2N9LJF4_9BACT|nr:Permease [Candidatus Sulfotelmatomonas gaucii]
MLLHDIRYALRQLRKSPGFTLTAVITLALGLTVNATIFFFINDLFLRPLPAADPARLVMIVQKVPQSQMMFPFSYQDFLDFRRYAEGDVREVPDMAKAFSGVMAFMEMPVHLSRSGEATERTFVHMASGNYFTVLGAQPMMGRLFLPNEGRTVGADAIIVLTYETWRSRFASDPHIVGQMVKLNGLPFTVVGVTPRGFVGAEWGTALSGFVPATMLPQMTPDRGQLISDRGDTAFFIMGRLQPSVSLTQARAAAALVTARLLKDYAGMHPLGAEAVVLRESMSRPSPFIANFTPLVLSALTFMALLVLGITVANVANLLYSRAADREREVAIRGALGATRWRLLRQLLAESTLVALTAGAIGAIAAISLSPILYKLITPGDMAPPSETGTDWRLFVFTFLASLITGILAGLLPALKATRRDVLPLLKNAPTIAGTRNRLRTLLVIGQVAFSCVVLICAGLALRSVQKLSQVNLGFRTDHLFLASVDLRLQRYSYDQGWRFQEQLLDKVRALPGVRDASLADQLPFDTGGGMRAGIWPEGQTPTERQKYLTIVCLSVDHAFLQTMGTRIVQGRDFTNHDDASAPRVVIINRVLAQQLWPNDDPVGKHLVLQRDHMMVVGVVGDMRVWTISDANRPLVFYPLAQHYQGNFTLVARTGMDPMQLTSPVTQIVAQLDADLPVYNVRTMDQQISGSPLAMAPMRFGFVIAGAQGIVALFLATLGLYGLIEYSVKRRIHEIGIRMALGANSGNVLRIVIVQGLRLVLIGLGLGLAAAFAVTRALSSVLYGVQPTDLLTFTGVSLLLGGVAVLASYIPARRAASIDPMQALRAE